MGVIFAYFIRGGVEKQPHRLIVYGNQFWLCGGALGVRGGARDGVGSPSLERFFTVFGTCRGNNCVCHFSIALSVESAGLLMELAGKIKMPNAVT
jgi:hypothetical protein